MKRYLPFALFFIFFIVFGNLSFENIHAQNPAREEFNRALNNYSLKYEEYNEAHDAYILARSQYLKFKTLASKTSAQAATARMLIARDEVVIYYLYAVRARLNDTSIDISDEKKNILFSRIDSETAWFNEHKATISSTNSLEDLVAKSKEASVRFNGLGFTVYDSLYSISGGRMLKYRERFNDFFLSLGDLINKIKTEERAEYSFSDEKLSTIDRWITETQDRLGKSTEAELKADELATRFGEKADNKGVYNQTIEALTSASTFLKEAIAYTKEIMREIKVAE